MNIKLHTPKSLKAGSGMASLKQFLLSLFATSVSIALTFGTAAIIDYKAKQKAKHEIVMMVMYDMYNSLESVVDADSSLFRAMDIQLQIAEDTTRFAELWKEYVITGFPIIEYTETTERIFSSNIETINTVGNVLFTENVADFYRIRNQYKTLVCDSLEKDFKEGDSFESVKDVLNFHYTNYAFLSYGFRISMQNLFTQCKQMMDVSDEELEEYRNERKQMQEVKEYGLDERKKWINKVSQHEIDLESAKKKLNLK